MDGLGTAATHRATGSNACSRSYRPAGATVEALAEREPAGSGNATGGWAAPVLPPY